MSSDDEFKSNSGKKSLKSSKPSDKKIQDRASKKHFKGENYDRVLKCCKKANVDTDSKTTGKTKEYPDLIKACYKQQKEVIKDMTSKLNKYGSSIGKANTVADITKKIENSMEVNIKKIKILDKIISYIEHVMEESEKTNNIFRHMSVKSQSSASRNKKNSFDFSKLDGEVIETYSIRE